MSLYQVGDKTLQALPIARYLDEVLRHETLLSKLLDLRGASGGKFSFWGSKQVQDFECTGFIRLASWRAAYTLIVFKVLSIGSQWRKVRARTPKFQLAVLKVITPVSSTESHDSKLPVLKRCSLMARFLFQSLAKPSRARGSPFFVPFLGIAKPLQSSFPDSLSLRSTNNKAHCQVCLEQKQARSLQGHAKSISTNCSK